jgi:hypothetical protein
MIEATIFVAVVTFVFGYVIGWSNGRRKMDKARIQLLQLAGRSGKLQDVRETAFYAAKAMRDNKWDNESHVERLEAARGIDRQNEKESGEEPQK